MILCLCKNIKDSELKNSSEQTLKQFCKITGLGSECGMCLLEAKKLWCNDKKHEGDVECKVE